MNMFGKNTTFTSNLILDSSLNETSRWRSNTDFGLGVAMTGVALRRAARRVPADDATLARAVGQHSERDRGWAGMLLLLFVGVTIYGPQVLLVGTAPADLAKKGTSAAAAGFVNCIGYVGAALLGDRLTGYLAEHHGWQWAIWTWAAWAFIGALLATILWNKSGDGD